MGFIGAGLLQGLGNGLVQQAAQVREDALIALKRKYQLEDNATANQNEIAKEGRLEQVDIRKDARAADVKTGLLTLAQEYKKQEGETEQGYKERLLRIRGAIESGQIDQRGKIDKEIKGMEFNNDKALAVLKSSLDKENDVASQKLKRDLERGEAKVVGRSPDGYIIIQRGDTGLVTTHTKMAAPGSGGDDVSLEDFPGGSKATPTPSATARPAAKAAAAPVKVEPKATVTQMQNSVDAMVASGSIPKGQQVGQTLTSPPDAQGDVTVLTWDGKRWKVPSA